MTHRNHKFDPGKSETERSGYSRRDFLRAAAALGLWSGLDRLAPLYAQSHQAGHGAPQTSVPSGNPKVIDLAIDRTRFPIGNRVGEAVTVNGTLPAPLLRFRQEDNVEIRVTNRLKERSSIHWHGILLPAEMDGVPGVTFKGIEPGETFVYRYQLKQYGTYWYHSHSGMQEQLGLYGPIIIDPTEPEPFSYDRDYVIVLSDWTFVDPERLMARLKKQSNFSNFQRRTLGDFFEDISQKGFKKTWSERVEWGKMRMDPTDIADLTGNNFTFLANGRPAANPWTGLFRPGERVRLRIINSAATTQYDVRIPGLKMTVIEADGQHVQPVEVEEFRIGAAETYDVLVTPDRDEAYTVFAETTDRSGYARANLAPREGLVGAVPPRRKRPLRTMADMGMGDMAGGDAAPGKSEMGKMSASDHAAMTAVPKKSPDEGMGTMPGMNHSAHNGAPVAVLPSSEHAGHGGMNNVSPAPSSPGREDHAGMAGMSGSGHAGMEMPENKFGPGNNMMAMTPVSRAHEPGTGLGEDGRRVLVYRDLVSRYERPLSEPGREIVLHITGNMERFIWGFDGKKFSEAEPIPLRFGERVRITFINDTMMEHPLHLHGMFMELENGAAGIPPFKHTLNVKPGEKTSVLVTADARGDWAFHCHLQYHMEAGMFRVFTVS